jgi:hypothetical protein
MMEIVSIGKPCGSLRRSAEANDISMQISGTQHKSGGDLINSSTIHYYPRCEYIVQMNMDMAMAGTPSFDQSIMPNECMKERRAHSHRPLI